MRGAIVHNPYYYESDISWVIRDVPYLSVGKLPFLAKMASIGTAYGHVLSQYPDVLCEPLDTHYVSLRGIAALDENLLKDLVLEYTWRQVACGAWLAALSPRQEYREHLTRRRPHVPHQQYIIDLALASIDGDCPPSMRESVTHLDKIKRSLAPLPKPYVPLRRTPNEDQRQVLKEECERVLREYRRGGVAAAQACLPGLLRGYYRLDYQSWRASLQPPG